MSEKQEYISLFQDYKLTIEERYGGLLVKLFWLKPSVCTSIITENGVSSVVSTDHPLANIRGIPIAVTGYTINNYQQKCWKIDHSAGIKRFRGEVTRQYISKALKKAGLYPDLIKSVLDKAKKHPVEYIPFY